jgi:chromate reductase, NAD(P)H dehydrogenase (quinone)
MKVLGISGSLRRDSHNTTLLRRAAELLLPSAQLSTYDELATIPPYDADNDDPATPIEAVESLREAVANADAILIATPEYNGSIPGALKNALDWTSRPFPDNAWRDKPVAVIGASTGISAPSGHRRSYASHYARPVRA